MSELYGIVSLGGTVIGASLNQRGLKGETGATGATGNGIASISKTGSSGLIDTYTITYTNGNTATFTVTNGQDGHSPIITASKSGKTTSVFLDGTKIAEIDDGVGIDSIYKTGSSGLDPVVDEYTILYDDGNYTTFTVTNGKKGDKGDTGATGNGIATIAKTSTSGLVDTYTITFTDGTSTTFEVTNGADGEITEDNLQGSLEDMLSGYSISNGNYDSNNEPYTFRKSGGGALVGVREDLELVGGSVAWNQLANRQNGQDADRIYLPMFNLNGTVGVVSGHKYLVSFVQPAGCAVYRQTGPRPGFPIVYKSYAAPSVNTRQDFLVGATDTASYDMGSLISKLETTEESYHLSNQMLFDLTQMFGSTIAEYIYTLEQGQAGAGVAWFRKLFPKPYYAYDAGTLKSVEGLQSHDTVGFNQWDEEWENGYINVSDGENVANNSFIRGKNFIPVFPNTKYYSLAGDGSADMAILYYDADKNYLNSYVYRGNDPFTTPSNCHYIRFYMASGYGNTYKNDICINLSWDGERNGEYEAYVKHSYPLDSSLTLRGIPKLDNGKLYYDGDTYESDGTVTRKYGIVDLGTLSWQKISGYNLYYASPNDMSTGRNIGICNKYTNTLDATASPDKTISYNNPYYGPNKIGIHDESYTDATAFKTAMSGVMLVYELATPTTETADTFENPQVVDASGTEEFVITTNVPVGNNTKYPPDDLGKLDMLANIPSPPNNNGTYTLEVTVLNGNTTYIWV